MTNIIFAEKLFKIKSELDEIINFLQHLIAAIDCGELKLKFGICPLYAMRVYKIQLSRFQNFRQKLLHHNLDIVQLHIDFEWQRVSREIRMFMTDELYVCWSSILKK